MKGQKPKLADVYKVKTKLWNMYVFLTNNFGTCFKCRNTLGY